MIGFGSWKLIGVALAAVSVLGYVGVLNINLAHERTLTARLSADLATEQGKYETCDARLTNLKERIKSDASVPDDLGGFPVNPEWLLPPR